MKNKDGSKGGSRHQSRTITNEAKPKMSKFSESEIFEKNLKNPVDFEATRLTAAAYILIIA